MKKIIFLSQIKNALSSFKKRYKKFPSFSQWKRVFRFLTKIERSLFFIFFTAALGAIIFLSSSFYLKNTEIIPARGGVYVEGIVGQPRFINPILAANDVDRDLTELLFSGLMKYDRNGKIVPDLARDYKIKEDGRVYEFYLKNDIFWHDGVPFSADDVIFTIQTIQNPEYKSSERANWLGVKVEKISDKTVRFSLKESYGPFLERTTIKILPKHIWQDISSQNLPLAVQYNLQPIGCGPYKFKEIQQGGLGNIKSLTLIANPDYFDKIPFISKIIFYFFDKEEELIKAAQRNEIQGLSLLNPKDQNLIKKEEFHDHRLSLPRYFAVFLRDEKPADEEPSVWAEKEIRQALNYATDKNEILDKVLDGQGKVVHSPILPEIYGLEVPSEIYEFSLEKAEELLKEAGFEKQNGKLKKIVEESVTEFKSYLEYGSRGKEVEALQECLSLDSEVYPEAKITGFFGPATQRAVIRFQEKYKEEILDPWGFKKGTGIVAKSTRAKLNEICKKPLEEISLKLSLITPNQPFLTETANLLKEQWQKIGIEVEIKIVETSHLSQDFIKPRDYEGLLFGQVLGGIPDLFPFWHSSWKEDPGLNLTLFGNKTADRLLEETRESDDAQLRAENYQKFQEILIKDAPAIFLYSPDYVYLVSDKIKVVDIKMITTPSKRFSEIENWYIETKRAWKQESET